MYIEAYLFLLEVVREGIPGARSRVEARRVLEPYLMPGPRVRRIVGRGGVYHRLAATAQDYGMAPTVVGRSVGGIEKLGPILGGFEPKLVATEYPRDDDWPRLLDRIVMDLQPRGKIRREPRSIWPRYCRSLISGARFLSQFERPSKFYAWCDRAQGAELPVQLSREVTGLGFALACALLMDLGYDAYLKPDVWVIRFCNELEITTSKDPLVVFEACAAAAEQAKVTPYAFDRVVWLLCTGNFWKHEVKVGGQLESFLTSRRLALRHQDTKTQREEG